MFHIACTRFTNTTYYENTEYRKNNDEVAINGATLKIRNTYSPGALIFVAEMNNELNRIEGIGLIRNNIVSDKRHKIYTNGDYNRYIYRGNYWISREQLLHLDAEILEILDTVLFKGKSNLKNRLGITVLSDRLFSHWVYELPILKSKVKKAFLKEYRYCELE